MIIERVTSQQYTVGLRKPLHTSRGTIVEREGLILIAETNTDLIGFGEIAPLPRHSNETLAEAQRIAEILCHRLRGRTVPTDLVELRNAYPGRVQDRVMFPSVAFGVDTLYADLAAKTAGCPISRWLSPQARQSVPVNAILSGTLEQIRKQIEEKAVHGYLTYKLKIGVENESIEKGKVALMRDLLGPDVYIRLDANRSLGCDQTLRFLRQVAEYDIEYIEEPLAPDLWSHLCDLRKESPIPVALDESLSDLNIGSRAWGLRDRCLHLVGLGALDVAVVKPTLAGGIGEVIDLNADLAQSGTRMVISSALESGVGQISLLHLAASLPGTLSACGLDTLSLFEDPLIHETLPLHLGGLVVPSEHGLGVTYRPVFSASRE
jgi:o-succinylbenzoate synthase